MSSFQVDRTQFPIGQGGFHATAVHRSDGKRLSMVVDCGGSDAPHRSGLIKVFGERGDKHDILAISHFDLDHIDGINQLHAAGITFRAVFLPHVDVSNYLLWMTLKLVAGCVDGAKISSAEIENIGRFVETSVRLYSGSYGRVVRVGSESAERSDLEPFEDSNFEEMLTKDSYAILKRAIEGDIFPHSRNLGFERLDWIIRFYSREWVNPKEVREIWNLPPFTSLKSLIDTASAPGGTSNWTDFATKLKSELRKKIPTNQAILVRNLLGASPSSKDPRFAAMSKLVTEIQNAAPNGISCKQLLTALYDLSTSLKDYNDASMCVYSGPAQRGLDVPRQQFSRSVQLGRWAMRTPPQQQEKSREVGWIATGDADFSTPEKLNDFLEHYHAEMALTSVFVLPHHGSKESFDQNMDRLRELIAELCERPLFIAPADPEHKKYHHPHWPVETTCRRYGDFHVVDKNRTSTYEESICAVHFRKGIWLFD